MPIIAKPTLDIIIPGKSWNLLGLIFLNNTPIIKNTVEFNKAIHLRTPNDPFNTAIIIQTSVPQSQIKTRQHLMSLISYYKWLFFSMMGFFLSNYIMIISNLYLKNIYFQLNILNFLFLTKLMIFLFGLLLYLHLLHLGVLHLHDSWLFH